jgi:methionyl-tRNA synthetase
VHLIGKDIMIPAHAVYWPIMLHAIGFPDDAMPKLVVHGFWNDKRGAKLSKSEGNVIDPGSRAERFTVDGLRYYLMSAIGTGKDADFSDERVEEAYSQDLAKNLGNLLNRTLNMPKRYRDSILTKDADYDDDLNREVRAAFEALPQAVAKHMTNYQVHTALENIWKALTLCNQYVEQTAPWGLAKDEAQATRLDTVLYHLAEAMAHTAFHIAPVMPGTSKRILSQLNYQFPEGTTAADLHWGLLPDKHQLGEAEILFPRLEPLVVAAEQS